MFSDILGYKVFNKGIEDLLIEIYTREKINIVSGNPEILYNGLKSEFLNNSFNSEHSIIIPDGVGTVLASKLVKAPVKERIAGIEVMKSIIKSAEREKQAIFLLGAKKEVVEKCAEKLQDEYPKLKIAGYHDGYFDVDNCEELIEDIKTSNPYAIFVAMGSPKQEQFIEKYFNELPCHIFMGVGGSFDVISGNLKRAPKWMRKIGLEWLYRVGKEPWRIKRLGAIPKFLLMVMKGKDNNE